MDRAEGKVLEPGPTILKIVGPEFLFKEVARNSGMIEQLVEETKCNILDFIIDPSQVLKHLLLKCANLYICRLWVLGLWAICQWLLAWTR